MCLVTLNYDWCLVLKYTLYFVKGGKINTQGVQGLILKYRRDTALANLFTGCLADRVIWFPLRGQNEFPMDGVEARYKKLAISLLLSFYSREEQRK